MATARFPPPVARSLRRAIGAAAFSLVSALVSGCAPVPPARPRVDAAALAREASAEIDRGCYLCLRSAAEKYEAAIAAGARSLDIETAAAWTLVAVRERELGLRSSDALERARSHGPAAPAVIDAYALIASSVSPLREGATTEASAAAARAARELMESAGGEPAISGPAREAGNTVAARPDPPAVALLRQSASASDDRAAAYLIQTLACSTSFRSAQPTPAAAAGPPGVREASSGLGTFLAATCSTRPDSGRDAAALRLLVENEPRFREARFFLGRLALGDRKLVTAEREFLAAADGLPAMAAAWAQLGGTRLLMEEYDWAAADIARALDVEPDQREALLAHARALNFAGRFEEALAPGRRLLDLGNWYVSDANYWLAFSLLQLGRLAEADGHVREAKRTNPMNGDTARLTGLVAHRLAELERAQTEFELAIARNPADCESHLHLGRIHGQKDRAAAAVESFVKARDCFAKAAESAAGRRREIDESSLPESRKQAAAARLARRIEGHRAARASASLGAAEGEAQRGSWDRALEYLAEADAEPGLAARARELRTRIAALRARR